MVPENNANQLPFAAPRTGLLTVRVGAYIAQLLFTVTFLMLVRRHLLSQEMANTLRNAPELQQAVQLLADALPVALVGVQGWVTHTFIKISGMIAQKKIDAISAHHIAVINAESGTPAPQQTELTVKTESNS